MPPVRYRIKGTGVYVKPMTASAGYEAASRGPRLVRWQAPSAGPNALLEGSLDTLRARSRDTVRQMGCDAAAGLSGAGRYGRRWSTLRDRAWNLQERLNRIEDNIKGLYGLGKWMLMAFGGSIIAAVVTFIVKGGLSVPPTP